MVSGNLVGKGGGGGSETLLKSLDGYSAFHTKMDKKMHYFIEHFLRCKWEMAHLTDFPQGINV